jgi:catechol 2,3-dioxygenase-like lactoylglutathione lyase family enzyme
MPSVQHLDHLVLTVKDIEKTAAFYQTILGMTKVVFGPGRVALAFGNQKINLHAAGKEFEPKAKFPTRGSADFCFLSTDPLEVWIPHLAAHGVKILAGPIRRAGALGPINSLYIRDLDDNLIEISNNA